ncbi:flagellar hook-basal body complex protein [Solimicrobium silvestre]|uniref:Flagellar hook protein FlgE n=1 Tax=Solimicrobium silvestre TaxID=2099400 RepID=A0A2S9H1S9_9BURK|nr:flagellar hook-basal body complex protein [Solimicrobium silvestre]PRC93917.1 Flagellar hook-basal body protein [Solimicrobium silvestre]
MSLSSSIDIGMSGLLGFSQELQTISNNVANLNTPGFKGSDSQFSDLFSQDNSFSGGSGDSTGGGMQVLPAVINFSQGQTTQTGVATNMVDSGNSFFVLKDPKTGQISYTQDGQFQFNSSGVLVDSTGNFDVQALDSSGKLANLTQSGLQNSLPKASSTITLAGNLSTTTSPDVVSSINVTDAAGGTHTLTATFTNSTKTPGTWTVSLADANGTVSSGGSFVFTNGTLTTTGGANSYAFTYSPAGVPAMNLTLTLDPSSTYLASSSTLGVESVDGYAAGTVTNATFNQSGTLVLSYSNGQTVNGPNVALANFSSTANLQHAGNNAFITSNNGDAQLGIAGNTSAWGTINSGSIQASNVDLSTEFSNIIITQRGYQAASEIVSTANQMMQNVLDMKGQG